jgi:hypothetical protein
MNKGIQLLIKRLRDEFRKENINLYFEEAYKEAERKYIKLRLSA